ncbi:MAG: hypothetical protein L0Z50_08085 [Verrucomicrobiales bacterium]|nr:hypothetical protein [Verrucomicrobiales bacterium]
MSFIPPASLLFLAAGTASAQHAVTDDAHVRNTAKEVGSNFGTKPNLQVEDEHGRACRPGRAV